MIRVWDLKTLETTQVLSGHGSGVCCLHLDEKYIISGSWDKTIRVWKR